MIEIVKKTKDFVVISKPAGLPSQADPSGDKDAMTECSETLERQGESGRLFLIHRLDRVVGGLMVFARNKKAAAELSRQVSERRFEKRYYAVVEGEAEGGRLFDYLYKDARVGKAFLSDRKRAGFKEAELEYNRLAFCRMESSSVTLVKIDLKTGRFHQIRAQFSSRKMPLIGDKKYGSRDIRAKMPALYATEISFYYNGKTETVRKLPPLTEYPWSLFGEENY